MLKKKIIGLHNSIYTNKTNINGNKTLNDGFFFSVKKFYLNKKGNFNSIKDGGGGVEGGGKGVFWMLLKKTPSTSFSSVFLSLYLVPVPNYWAWIKTTLQKMRFFWSNSFKIDVLITSLIEMLELPNFGHMKTFTI